MLRLCCIVLLLSIPGARADAQNNKAAWDAFYAKQTKIRQQGREALERQRTQSKGQLCDEAGKSEAGGIEIADCLNGELKSTNQDYLTYERAISELLQLPTPDEAGQKTPKRLSFDAAEESWQRYRDQTCTSMATQWADVQSSIAAGDCRLRLTWSHMHELDSLYGDLWH
jgi:hypothetical protein